jgi:hypothetical protein
VISARLPMGVATTYNPFGIELMPTIVPVP